ncbi:MAG: glycosyltransferase family 4 protein [Armatimonadota bacterium]
MKNLPRISLLSETYPPIVGGGETYARLLADQCRRLGMDVFVLTRRVRADMIPVEDLDGTTIFRLPPVGMLRFGKYVMFPPLAWTLFKMRHRYDVIYVSNFRVLGLVAVPVAKLLGKRCVLRSGTCGEMSCEYTTVHRKKSSLVGLLLAWPKRLRRWILLGADAFVSANSAIAEEFAGSGVPPEKIRTIHNGVDTDRFQPAGLEEKAALRRRLGLPEDAFMVGYSGKLNKGKGLDHLISVWPAVSARCPGAHLVLIGGGGDQTISCEAELREFVREHRLEGTVTFSGYVQNVSDYLRALDIFTLPTEYEGLSNAVLEAMACGLPCVTSDVGGLPDIITHSIDGLLLPPGDRRALVEALCGFFAEPESAIRVGSTARETVQRRFSLAVATERQREFFAGLMCEPGDEVEEVAHDEA